MMLSSALPPPSAASLSLNNNGSSGGSATTQSEGVTLLQHVHGLVNKRISTLDYLRTAHEGRLYWFNTLRVDRTDLTRMPYYDARKLARRATNYLLLGLSLPAVVDLNSANVVELLRSLTALFTEFETFQQLHSETGTGSSAASSLSRAARLPNMFRRAPVSKVRRTSSSAASGSNDFGSSFDGGSGGVNGGHSGASGPPPPSSHGTGSAGDSFGGSTLTLVNSESGGSFGGNAAGSTAGSFGGGGVGSSSMGGTATSTAFATYYDNNTDLLPGEEYAFLLTPSLPFDPDFFETFATLCDVLIDSYQRILSLMPTSRECSPLAVELLGKMDARMRKLLVYGVVKEYEEHSRGGVKTEVANIGKVVLGGLM
ncbi:hypothetical protein SEPCBS119000_006656 [Sporothrix epigloea]|uniref:Uncharacterized protein n=1 Tax=Sporothrix epigloea TaxID=1892477 RepID=A0ABP0E7D8_9PEZI